MTQCITCSRFKFGNREMARAGFGNCVLEHVSESVSSLFERECGKHAQLEQGLVDKRIEWLNKGKPCDKTTSRLDKEAA